MKFETFQFEREHGFQIFTYKWLPDQNDNLKGIVQIAHGMAEHAQRYERFAQALVEAGFAVYANDHRGHGQTAGALENVGYFADENGWEKVVEDMHQLTLLIQKNHSDLPIFLFGHSMGSLLSRNYIYQHGNDLKGVLLSGTSGDPGFMIHLAILLTNFEIKRKGCRARSSFLNKLTFGNFNRSFQPNRTEFDWLSHDPEEVDKYIADPYCGAVFTAGFFNDLMRGIYQINLFENIQNIPQDLPVYLFSGDKDPVGNNGKDVLQVSKAYQKAGIRDVQYKLYPNGRHEMLNETNKEEVFQDILRWLVEHLSGDPT